VASPPRPARPPRGLGQGLSLLLGDRAVAEEGRGRLLEIALGDIDPNPRQPRVRLDEAELAELVESVRRDGVVQPVLVRPSGDRFELIAGERRWRAAAAAGLEVIPALVRDVDERESLALALVENVVRADLNPVEQARGYARLVDEFGLSQSDVARAVGRGRVSVANSLRLLDLPDDVLGMLEDGSLTEGHGRAILGLADHDARRDLARRVARQGLSVRATEEAARTAARRPSRARRRPGPTWYDADLAHDVVDGVWRALGLTGRVVPVKDGCRIEIDARSAQDLARVADALGALPDRRPPGA
jgi:ParB family chromosome partitioning protein